MHVWSDHEMMKFDIEKTPKTFSACVQAYGSFCNTCFFTLLGDYLDIHNWSEYEEKFVGFNHRQQPTPRSFWKMKK